MPVFVSTVSLIAELFLVYFVQFISALPDLAFISVVSKLFKPFSVPFRLDVRDSSSTDEASYGYN